MYTVYLTVLAQGSLRGSRLPEYVCNVGFLLCAICRPYMCLIFA